MSFTLELLTWIQFASLAALCLLGLHRGWMVLLYWRHRRSAANSPAPPTDLPHVTIQLPIYNERHVAARLVAAVAAIDYPRDRLEIQVLDDSTDDTSGIVAEAVHALPADLNVAHVQRSVRTDYKAGALAAGLQCASGDLVAVFDADFVPPANFLSETVPWFADPHVGMVQCRWDHLNPDYNLLTRMQALLLDGHFAVEHIARSRSGCFFNFNGTAGVFRRQCIDDAGGWQGDTLTEDMDLSYRAQLAGWRFVYRPDVPCPAELPIETDAFLNQQHRWAKGSVQTGRKLLGRIWRAPISLLAKAEATVHLFGNVAFPLLLCLIVVAMPLQLLRLLAEQPAGPWLAAWEGIPLIASTLCVLLYYSVAQHSLQRLTSGGVLRTPLVIAIGAGLCVNNTAAVWSGLFGPTGHFRRTPKLNVVHSHTMAQGVRYTAARGATPWVELGLGMWAATTALLAVRLGTPFTAVFHGLFASGLIWVGTSSLLEGRFKAISPTAEPTGGTGVLAGR